MVWSHVAFIVLCAWAPFGDSERAFLALFFLLGLALSLGAVGAATLDLEISPAERRPTYQALLGLFVLAGVLVSSLLSTLIRSATNSFAALAWTAGLILLLSLIVTVGVPEPRQRALGIAQR